MEFQRNFDSQRSRKNQGWLAQEIYIYSRKTVGISLGVNERVEQPKFLKKEIKIMLRF